MANSTKKETSRSRFTNLTLAQLGGSDPMISGGCYAALADGDHPSVELNSKVLIVDSTYSLKFGETEGDGEATAIARATSSAPEATHASTTSSIGSAAGLASSSLSPVQNRCLPSCFRIMPCTMFHPCWAHTVVILLTMMGHV